MNIASPSRSSTCTLNENVVERPEKVQDSIPNQGHCDRRNQNERGSTKEDPEAVAHNTRLEDWLPGKPLKFSIPKNDQDPWEGCHKRIEKYDDGMCKVWKGEIDNLLIFAGLFSAAVTAFAVESYQWLDDPRDENTILLAQLLTQFQNFTSPSTNPSTFDQVTPFVPSGSAVRINIFWFLSLILSLSTVLIGILCLQWLREFQRDGAFSFKDALAIRQLRYEGLIGWKVPQIISFLPVLLQLAVVLFFAGLFDLLWARHRVVASVILVPVVLIVTFLIITTMLPCLQWLIVNLNTGPLSRPSLPQCPYKSPQSWIFQHAVLRPVHHILHWLKKDILWKRDHPKGWQDYDSRWRTFFFDTPLLNQLEPRDTFLLSILRWMRTNDCQTIESFNDLYACFTTLDLESMTKVVSPSLNLNNQSPKEMLGIPQPLGSTNSGSTNPNYITDEVQRELAQLAFLTWNNTKEFSSWHLNILELKMRLLNLDPKLIHHFDNLLLAPPSSTSALQPSTLDELESMVKLPPTPQNTQLVWEVLIRLLNHELRSTPGDDGEPSPQELTFSHIKDWFLRATSVPLPLRVKICVEGLLRTQMDVPMAPHRFSSDAIVKVLFGGSIGPRYDDSRGSRV